MAFAAGAEVVTYPAGEGVATLPDQFSVSVRPDSVSEWMPVDVYPVRLDRVDFSKHSVQTASMAYFDFSDRVEVRVIAHTPQGKVESVSIRPRRTGIVAAVEADTITFALTEPENLSVEVNGDIFHNLHLFANPLATYRPPVETPRKLKRAKNLVYFAPGFHRIEGDTLRVASGTRVYVDGGAYVEGQILCEGVSDVRIQGRGEIRPRGRGEGIYIKHSQGVEVDGVIVSQVPVGASRDVAISNVKSLTHYSWGDGMNIFASSNVVYDRVFCRNSDDCHTVYATRKGFCGGCSNIVMTNSTLWADVAHPINIGLHGAATEIGLDAPSDTICNLVYRNIDILDHQERQLDCQGVLAIVAGDNNVVHTVRFDDIRIDDIRAGRLFDIRIPVNKKYCAAPGRSISDILFKDVTYNGSNAELSLIIGYDESRTISGITFDNLNINGVRISDDMPQKPKWYKTGDFARIFVGEHVDNVVFK